MKIVFADTGYWIAMLNPADALRPIAEKVSATIAPVRIITSEMVLTEVLNAFAGMGARFRGKAVELVESLYAAPDVEVVPATGAFAETLELYKKMDDKEWGYTDCDSILIMRARGLSEALAHDHHFQQAGFVALLRNA